MIGSQDSAVALSGQLKTVAVTVMKISNDLRWMNSGPLAGLGEIYAKKLIVVGFWWSWWWWFWWFWWFSWVLGGPWRV